MHLEGKLFRSHCADLRAPLIADNRSLFGQSITLDNSENSREHNEPCQNAVIEAANTFAIKLFWVTHIFEKIPVYQTVPTYADIKVYNFYLIEIKNHNSIKPQILQLWRR